MEIKQIKELMTAMGRTGTKRLSIKKEGFELELEREESGVYRQPEPQLDEENGFQSDNPASRRVNLALARAKEATLAGGQASPQVEEKEDLASTYVTSPMVGTFYSTPSPEDPPFVKVGDRIDKNTVVCIIEAMKVMNEVKAGVSGTVVELLAENGHPVEFGSKLFRINA